MEYISLFSNSAVLDMDLNRANVKETSTGLQPSCHNIAFMQSEACNSDIDK